MTWADIIGGTVEMERCGDDPLPLARKRLYAALSGLAVVCETLFWDGNYVSMPGQKEVKEPGWRSKARFDSWR